MKISVKNLKVATATYLIIPFFIFFLAWLKPQFGLPLSAILVFCFYRFWQKTANDDIFEIPLWQALTSLLVIVLWVGVSGNGAMGVQWNDLMKPLAISRDIMVDGQPLLYKNEAGEQFFLSQYLGYYITIPTLFGFLGWKGVLIATYVYLVLGVALAMTWFQLLSGSFSPLVVLFFVFFAGIDFLGYAASVGLKPALKSLWTDFYSIQPFWGNSMVDPQMPFLYQSNSHTLFWSPQHALAAWLGMGPLMYDLLHKKNMPQSPFYLALTFFWSPFIAIGLLPFLVVSAFKKDFAQYFSLQNILMVPILLVIVWYMSSLPLQKLRSGFIFYKTANLSGYLLQLKAYSIFWIAEVGVWMLPICFVLGKNLKHRFWVYFTLILLSLIPFYVFGKFNDWAQRVSMPAIFMMAVYVIKTFRDGGLLIKACLVCVFLASAWDPLYFVSHSLKFTKGQPLKFMPNDFEKTPNFYQACVESGFEIKQFMAPTSASFYQVMCRKK